jgi:lysophospholipid acyltransferase (LPLAT)-like uncharacterized protein
VAKRQQKETKRFSKKLKEFFQITVLPLPSYLLIRILWATVRVRFTGKENLEPFLEQKKPFIFAFWHGTLLLMVYAFKSEKRTFLVSFHRDGELITRVIRRFGIEATRGSTTRGGVKALLSLVRRARRGYSIAFTPDGPKGPPKKVQQGVVELARLTGIPVVPVGFCAKHAIKMNSWDSFLVPLPFTKAAFCYGKPVIIGDEQRKNGMMLVEKALNEAEENAKKEI